MKQFYFYPCTKTGKMKKGFCRCIGSAYDLLKTLNDWRKFAKRFNLKYYAFKPADGDMYTVVELFPQN